MSAWDEEIVWKRLSAGRYLEPSTGMEIQRVKNYWLALVPVRWGGLDPAGDSATLANAKKSAALQVKVRRLLIVKAEAAAYAEQAAIDSGSSPGSPS